MKLKKKEGDIYNIYANETNCSFVLACIYTRVCVCVCAVRACRSSSNNNTRIILFTELIYNIFLFFALLSLRRLF
jgi:hypothetical protein